MQANARASAVAICSAAAPIPMVSAIPGAPYRCPRLQRNSARASACRHHGLSISSRLWSVGLFESRYLRPTKSSSTRTSVQADDATHLIGARKSVVRAEPTFERLYESVGHSPLLAACCLMQRAYAMWTAQVCDRQHATLNCPSTRGDLYGSFQGESVIRAVMSVGKCAGSYIFATSSSS